MNSCEHYQELISRLVDGEISHDEHEALMDHMKTCSRCNAMYAVFHDLSDILSEETEPLPEGLHENIMAGVRRSEIIRKNRRMRRLGLRTALTAAACLVLVLFAATTLTPRLRSQDVAVRSEEALSVLESPAIPSPAVSAEPAPTVEAAAPIQNTAPKAPDASLAAGDSTEAQYNTQQPVQDFDYQPVTPEEVYTPAPAQVYYTPAPVSYVAPTPVPDAAPPQAPSAEQAAPDPVISLHAAAPELPFPGDVSVEPAAPEEQAYAQSDVFFGISDDEVYAASPFEEIADDTDEDPGIWAVASDDEEEEPAVEAVEPEEESPEKKPDEQRLTVRGKEARGRLLALLGGSEEALPPEAELTRVIHLTLVPEDAYGSEEKLDVSVYGDFVFYRLSASDGSRSFRAACSLAELDSFLKDLSAAPTPTPAPTQDPYAFAIPA